MSNTGLNRFRFLSLVLFIVINENTVQWSLAVIVGGYSVGAGFTDAFQYFSLTGYLFFSLFRAIPYLALHTAINAMRRKQWRVTGAAAWGGLLGIVLFIIYGAWSSMHAYYTDVHVSSTTAIAFIFIPIYALITGFIGALLGGGVFLLLAPPRQDS